MKRIITLAFAAIAAVCLLSGCIKGKLAIQLSPYNYSVNEKFSLFNGLEIQNDFDGVVSISDPAKWTFIISDEVVANMEREGYFVTVTAPCEGTVSAIYDREGLNIVSNTVPIIIK